MSSGIWWKLSIRDRKVIKSMLDTSAVMRRPISWVSLSSITALKITISLFLSSGSRTPIWTILLNVLPVLSTIPAIAFFPSFILVWIFLISVILCKFEPEVRGAFINVITINEITPIGFHHFLSRNIGILILPTD